MTAPAEQQAISVEVPEYGFEIMPDAEGKPFIVGLTIRTSGSEYKSFLCLPNATAVEMVARAFNRELLKVATTLKRQGKHIQPVTGVNSDALRTEKRREQRGSRGSRS